MAFLPGGRLSSRPHYFRADARAPLPAAVVGHHSPSTFGTFDTSANCSVPQVTALFLLAHYCQGWRYAMTSFPLDITRVTVNLVNLLRWKRHYESAKLENLSDRSLEDIGLEPARRNFAAVMPFWMP